MGVIVQLQPGDGILVKHAEVRNGDGGSELLVLKVETADGDKFTAQMLHSAYLGRSWRTECDGRYIFVGEILDHDPFKVRIIYRDTKGRMGDEGLHIEKAVYLGAPLNETFVTVPTTLSPHREVPCHLGGSVLSFNGSNATVKAVYDGVVVLDNQDYVYLHSRWGREIDAINWPYVPDGQTSNFAGADIQLVPISDEVAKALDEMDDSPEYETFEDDHPELFSLRSIPRTTWPDAPFRSFLDKPHPTDLLDNNAPHVVLCLVDTVGFFMKNDWRYELSEKRGMGYSGSNDYVELLCKATRAITDRLEVLADLIHEMEYGDVVPCEVLIREKVAILKETPEYQSVGVFGEKCEETCDFSCDACGGGKSRPRIYCADQYRPGVLPMLWQLDPGSLITQQADDSTSSDEPVDSSEEDSEGKS